MYCNGGNRRGAYEHTWVHLPRFTFQARRARNGKDKNFTNSLLTISKEALKKISREIRSWQLHLRIGLTFAELARRINPIVRGWMQYYGAFYRSALQPPSPPTPT